MKYYLRHEIINYKALNSPEEYPSNMSNPVLKWNIQGRKHPGSCAFTKPEQLSYRKPKRSFKNKTNGHKNPNNNCFMMRLLADMT